MLTEKELGADRVLEPAGALPQAAERLDASGPARPHEVEIKAEMLCLDSTSFAQLSRECDRDPDRIAAAIVDIVESRGKMHNPVTGSGGILVGTASASGDEFPDPPPPGERVVTLASLTLTPLALDSIGEIDVGSPQIPVSGRAYLAPVVPWTPYPDDLSLAVSLAVFDVCGAPSHTAALASEGDTVLVLGAGHAGLLAMAAAREAVGERGSVVAIDADREACNRARRVGLCDAAIQTDLRDGIGTLRALSENGVSGADLTVVVVNSGDCEAAAILATKDSGTILFFSMATSFSRAALGAEGIASRARMLIGSGYADDRGAYAVELVRAHPGIAEAFEHEERSATDGRG